MLLANEIGLILCEFHVAFRSEHAWLRAGYAQSRRVFAVLSLVVPSASVSAFEVVFICHLALFPGSPVHRRPVNRN